MDISRRLPQAAEANFGEVADLRQPATGGGGSGGKAKKEGGCC